MFRNARFYRFDGDWPATEDAASAELGKIEFRPCGPLTEKSSGWVPVDTRESGPLARRVNGADLLRLRTQSRVLPAAAVNEALEARLEAFRARTGEEPTRRETRKIKAEIRDELLTKSLVRSERTWGYVDVKEKLIAIDAAALARCERFLDYLRVPFDGLEIKPLTFAKPLDTLLTGIFLGDAPPAFQVGRECRMRDAQDTGSVVRWTNFDLSDKSIRDHVIDGMPLTHLAIEYAGILGCVLDHQGTISKLKLLGADAETDLDDDPQARLDAEFVLLTGTLRQLVADLGKLLGGYAR